ncbi:hypothetical protein D0X99_17270 [Algoriphagus lacus]|uniref:PglD N-terminal domain-containing protein n=1 Tax=Algoriphagus lacus TaxID=2056311 RepID=A0A418PN00_9BACT|nr:hypothetical protein [Algoriphagus lacus]RIW13159.1 hypothetical protein D0X99_17270 [Algoriphagus lacus]
MNLIIAGADKLGEYIAKNYSQFKLRHKLIGFVDDDPKFIGKEFAGYPFLGSVDQVLKYEKVALVLALRNPSQKIDIVRRLHYHPSLDFPNLFSNGAWVSRDCIFGKGNIILEGTLINFGTLLGNFNCIDQNCSIGHESVIGNYCTIEESVTFNGYSFLEDEGKIGREAVIGQGVRIGRDAEIFPKVQILQDVPAESRIKK